jgi:hypothetical protein
LLNYLNASVDIACPILLCELFELFGELARSFDSHLIIGESVKARTSTQYHKNFFKHSMTLDIGIKKGLYQILINKSFEEKNPAEAGFVYQKAV